MALIKRLTVAPNLAFMAWRKQFLAFSAALILASLFSAIVFTRIIFDYMVIERRMAVSYG